LFGEIIAVRSGRTGDSVKQRSALPEHSRADFVSTGFDGTVGGGARHETVSLWPFPRPLQLTIRKEIQRILT
jgi:hypothetical protein